MRGLRSYPATLAACVALSLSLAACGGEDDKDGGGGTTAATLPESVEQSLEQAEPKLGDPREVPEGAQAPSQQLGDEAADSERENAARVLAVYFAALSKRDLAGACALLDPALSERLGGIAGPSGGEETSPDGAPTRSCPAILSRISRAPALAERLRFDRLLSLRTDGDRGIAVYAGPKGSTSAIAMARDGEAWRVAAIVPVPIG